MRVANEEGDSQGEDGWALSVRGRLELLGAKSRCSAWCESPELTFIGSLLHSINIYPGLCWMNAENRMINKPS